MELEEIPRVPWSTFRSRLRWRQGEHITAVGPTGVGKTTLFSELVPMRDYSIFFGTKPEDPLYRDLMRRQGFRRVESIDDVKSYDHRILLWPKPRRTIRDTVLAQRVAFREALDVIVAQRSWALWVDEMKYLAEFLKLRSELTYCLEQLRSINATVIAGAQRPAWIPLSALANSSHVFLWRSANRDDARRLSDVGGVDAKQIMEVARRLDPHEFIHVHTRGTEVRAVRSEVKVSR